MSAPDLFYVYLKITANIWEIAHQSHAQAKENVEVALTTFMFYK